VNQLLLLNVTVDQWVVDLVEVFQQLIILIV